MKRCVVCVLAVLLFALLGATNVAAEGGDGMTLFTAQKCNMCHSVASASIEAKTTSEKMRGPDLGGITKEADWIAKFVKKEVQKDGADHKATFKGTDAELDAIITWLQAQAKAE